MPLLRSGRITSMPMNINCYANKKRKYYDDEDFAPPLKKYRQKTKAAPRITAKRIRRQSQKVTAAVHRTPIVETHNIPSRALVILTDTESEEETQEPVRQVDLSSVSLIPDMKNSHHSRNNRGKTLNSQQIFFKNNF